MDYTETIVNTYLAARYGARRAESILDGLTKLRVIGEDPKITSMHRKLLYNVTLQLEIALSKCFS